MSDPSLLVERLQAVAAALLRIPERMASIHQPTDFRSSPTGIERMDSICMVLIACGEEFKKIDRQTGGNYLPAIRKCNGAAPSACEMSLRMAILMSIPNSCSRSATSACRN
jgi:hypothetical protein